MTTYTLYPTNITGPNPTVWVVFDNETQDAVLRTENRTEAEMYISEHTTLSSLRSLRLARVAFCRAYLVYTRAIQSNMPAPAISRYLAIATQRAQELHNLITR